jgi:hypothetical protein
MPIEYYDHERESFIRWPLQLRLIWLHNGFWLAQFQMQSKDSTPFPTSSGKSTNIQECVSEWIQSAEFRAIADLVAQVPFFRAETHMVTWETFSILFYLPQSTLQGWLHGREKPMENTESLDLANADLSGPTRFLGVPWAGASARTQLRE